MILAKRGRGRRSAFTLIELLVVIAIIAILVALTGAAVMRALVNGPRLATKTDIQELDQKMASMMNQPSGALTYVPSRLHLSKTNNYNLANQLDIDSIAFLQSRFGGRHACFNFQPPPAGQFIDWNGDGQSPEELFLEGEQCLVFYLGGIPQIGSNGAVGMTGWSNNSQNPAQLGGTRQLPYFEFQPNRLRLLSCTTPTPNTYFNGPYTAANAKGTFPIYLDAWKAPPSTVDPQGPKPYLFFSPRNGVYNQYVSSDCPSFLTPPDPVLPLPVSPYVQSSAPTTTFVNANSYQIISAGRLGTFGQGGATWSPTNGTSDPNGKENQSNFSPTLLGQGPN